MRNIACLAAVLATFAATAVLHAASTSVGGIGYSDHVTGGINSAMDSTVSRGGGPSRTGSVGPGNPVTSSTSTGDTAVTAGKGFKAVAGGIGSNYSMVGGQNARTSVGGIGTTSSVPGGISK